MKPLAQHISMTSTISLLVGLALVATQGGGMANAAAVVPAHPADQALAADIVARSAIFSGYPTFCQIPASPNDIRPPTSFRTSVFATRLAGASVVARTAPDTFTLRDTDAFAVTARAEAVPPPPEEPVQGTGTDAFVKDALQRAAPPGRK